MRYLLDTDTCIYLINRRPGYDAVLKKLDGLTYGEVLISGITLAELSYGVAKSGRRDHNRFRLEHFLARFEAAEFGEEAASAYGPLRMGLERKGRPIGPLDTLIAAHALALRAVLVTNNTREFARIPGLKIERWIA